MNVALELSKADHYSPQKRPLIKITITNGETESGAFVQINSSYLVWRFETPGA